VISVVETFVNTGAFGIKESRSRWKIPLDNPIRGYMGIGGDRMSLVI